MTDWNINCCLSNSVQVTASSCLSPGVLQRVRLYSNTAGACNFKQSKNHSWCTDINISFSETEASTSEQQPAAPGMLWRGHSSLLAAQLLLCVTLLVSASGRFILEQNGEGVQSPGRFLLQTSRSLNCTRINPVSSRLHELHVDSRELVCGSEAPAAWKAYVCRPAGNKVSGGDTIEPMNKYLVTMFAPYHRH
jgi:hypothetical protein